MSDISRSAVTAMKAYLAENKDHLQARGVVAFFMNYAGEGDEGQIEETYAETASGETIALSMEQQKLLDDLEPAGSYGDGTGGGGEIRCYVADGRIVHESYHHVVVNKPCGNEEL